MLKEGRVSTVGIPSEVMSVEILRERVWLRRLGRLHPESGLPRITLPRQLHSPFEFKTVAGGVRARLPA